MFIKLIALVAIIFTTASVDAQFGLPNPVSTVTNAAGGVLPFSQIQSQIAGFQGQLGQAIGANANAKLTDLFPGIRDIAPATLAKCYNSSIGGSSFNIFENNPFDIINAYYKEFPENFALDKLSTKAANLFKTFAEIATRSISCVADPAQQSFQVGLNKLSDFSLDEFAQLMGAFLDPQMGNKYRNRPKPSDNDPDEDAPTNRRGGGGLNPLGGGGNPLGGLFRGRRATAEAVPIDAKCFPKNKAALPGTLDYKSLGKMTPVRYQGTCGSCWAFASIAALESAYLIQGKTADAKFDLSEQQLVACANDKFCNGGTSVDAFNFLLLNKGVTDEKTIGYDNSKKTCETKKKKRHGKIKDYCLRGIYAEVNGKPEELTDNDIMSAIREFGVVYSTVYGENSDLKNYKSGVYNDEKCPKETNHAINIVGWDKDAWIVRNSWGSKWGEDGFFRLKRGSNMCGINTYITYPILS